MGCPCGEGGDGHDEPTSPLQTCLDGVAIEEIRNMLELWGGYLCGNHKFGSCGFSGHGYDTRGWFLFRLPSSLFSCCCEFRLKFLQSGRLPGSLVHVYQHVIYTYTLLKFIGVPATVYGVLMPNPSLTVCCAALVQGRKATNGIFVRLLMLVKQNTIYCKINTNCIILISWKVLYSL